MFGPMTKFPLSIVAFSTILGSAVPAMAQLDIPAEASIGAPIESPAVSGVCAQSVSLTTGPDPHDPDNLDYFQARIDDPTLPDVAEFVDNVRFPAVNVDRLNDRCNSRGEIGGGADWPGTSGTGSNAMRVEGLINVRGTAGMPVNWTLGVHSNDAVRVTIGGVVVQEFGWISRNWKRYRFVTFGAPGLYPIRIDWSTNHNCSADPLEIMYAPSHVDGYDGIDCSNFEGMSRLGGPCNNITLSTSAFEVLGGDVLLPVTSGNGDSDSDSDGDGVADLYEGASCGDSRDSDGDGTPDIADPDDDGDGIPTADEQPDVDGDGQPDDAVDTDDDGTPDYRDPDDDGDSVPTELECSDPSACEDLDNDGVANYLDPDDDGDSVPTRSERPSEDVDTDNDGSPDHLDPDDDGDGIPTAQEAADGSTHGNDIDGDGNVNWQDVDSDGDGRNDSVECADGANPCPDEDEDGVPDYLDPMSSTDREPTDETNDRDRDGVNDSEECDDVSMPETCPDTDGDGRPDFLDTDDDGDGILTRHEIENGDTDGDGVDDYLDDDDDGDGRPTVEEGADPNEDGDPNDALDFDGDGVPAYLDAAVSPGVSGGALGCAVTTKPNPDAPTALWWLIAPLALIIRRRLRS